MNNKIVVLILTLSSFSLAILNDSELINIAGKQKMLSQRIAKDYIYVVKNVAKSKANRQLKESMEDFLSAHKKLLLSVNDPKIKNILTFIELSSIDFKNLTSKEFNINNAELILELSESMLERSQRVFEFLQGSLDIKESDIIENSSELRMLSQRIAKYYICYQSGIRDKNSVKIMKKTIDDFSEKLKLLLNNSSNTPQINRKLSQIDELWKIVSKFYTNMEKGGLPLIVFDTTDDIAKKVDEVTQLYLSLPTN